MWVQLCAGSQQIETKASRGIMSSPLTMVTYRIKSVHVQAVEGRRCRPIVSKPCQLETQVHYVTVALTTL